MQALGCGDVDAARALLHDGTELAQDVQVVVDGPVADLAAAKVRDEGLADRVDQGSAQQDRNPGVAGVGVNGRAGRRLGSLGIQGQVPGDRVLLHRDAVQLQQAGDNLDVLDFRHVAQHGRLVAQQGRHHRLGDKVLGPANGDAAGQRDAAADCQNTTHLPVSSRLLAPKSLQRLQPSIGARVTELKYGGRRESGRGGERRRKRPAAPAVARRTVATAG